MRIILSLLLLTSIAAAEQEEFTLTDGRKFTGTYDKETQSLYIDPAGKMSLHITPDQIADRKPVKVTAKVENPAKEDSASPESMTKTEKALAMNNFRSAKAEEEMRQLLAEADKKDKEADECTKKADAAKEKINDCAKSFQKRGESEGEGHSIEEIKTEKIALKKTNANNSEILNLIAWRKKMIQQAKELTAAAKALRDKASPPAAKAAPAGSGVAPRPQGSGPVGGPAPMPAPQPGIPPGYGTPVPQR